MTEIEDARATLAREILRAHQTASAVLDDAGLLMAGLHAVAVPMGLALRTAPPAEAEAAAVVIGELLTGMILGAVLGRQIDWSDLRAEYDRLLATARAT